MTETNTETSTETRTETTRPRSADHEVWLRRGCALIVAAVAAYGSYQHQRDFALHGGADPVSAAMWPLSVDGLLLLATVGLLKSGQQASRRVQLAVWLSFLLGIAVSLAANIAAAPTLAWQPILVAGWPPVALLLAAELLTHHPRPREQTQTEPAASTQELDRETGDETEPALVAASEVPSLPSHLPSSSCGSTSAASRPADAPRPVRNWTGSRGPTTTGAPCYADGATKAASHQRIRIDATGIRCPAQAALDKRRATSSTRESNLAAAASPTAATAAATGPLCDGQQHRQPSVQQATTHLQRRRYPAPTPHVPGPTRRYAKGARGSRLRSGGRVETSRESGGGRSPRAGQVSGHIS